MRKFIFLDIDGVLNYNLMYEDKTQHIKFEEEGYPLCDLSEDKIKYLNEIIEKTGAKVVVSSTWRLHYNVEKMQSYLKQKGFVGEIIDCTPNLRNKDIIYLPRGVEIYNWIKENTSYGEEFSYVILDDDSDMLLCQKDNFICIDGYIGITPKTVFKAINILNRWYNEK